MEKRFKRKNITKLNLEQAKETIKKELIRIGDLVVVQRPLQILDGKKSYRYIYGILVPDYKDLKINKFDYIETEKFLENIYLEKGFLLYLGELTEKELALIFDYKAGDCSDGIAGSVGDASELRIELEEFQNRLKSGMSPSFAARSMLVKKNLDKNDADKFRGRKDGAKGEATIYLESILQDESNYNLPVKTLKIIAEKDKPELFINMKANTFSSKVSLIKKQLNRS